MEQRILAMWAAHFASLTFVLLLLLVGDCVFLVAEARRRSRRVIPAQVREFLQQELSTLAADLRKANEDARERLAELAALQAAAQEEASRLQLSLAAPKPEYLPAETAMLPALAMQQDVEWASPESLLRLARQTDDWPRVASCLARIDRDQATSRNLETAAGIFRDHGFYVKAVELYREAVAKDPENLTARADLLALSAETRATERNESLEQLQEMVAQSLRSGVDGAGLQERFFRTMTELGRHTELAEFCAAQLKDSLPAVAEARLHRQLASACDSLGKVEEAVVHCEAALQLLGEDGELLGLYTRLLLHARQYEEAYRMALRALQSQPALAQHYMLLAEIQEKRVGRAAANELLRKALQWADDAEACEIDARLRRLSALDELSEILPATRPQIIQA